MPAPFSSLTPFRIPKHISPEQHTNYCLEVLDKYRTELQPLRQEASRRSRQVKILQSKLQQTKEECNQLKAESRQLKKEIEKLARKLKKLTKSNNRYCISLFDHGNFSHPDRKNKKKKGGQPGHQDTNRESKEDPNNYSKKRLFLKRCPKCQKSLKRVGSSKQKILIDILLNPQVVKFLIQSERQWCGNCKQEVLSKDERSLPFTEYGINIFIMVLILRYRCLLSFSKISLVIEIIGGVKLANSQISNILRQAKKYLKHRYDELIEIVRRGEIMYNDETGWLVRGKKAWLWIMANEEATVYKAAESRGKGIFEEMRGTSQSASMHDGYGAYKKTIPKNKQRYCWSHILRFAFEETYEEEENQDGVKIRDQLVDTYHLINMRHKHTEKEMKNLIEKKLDTILANTSKEESVSKIQNRVKAQKQGLINALLYTKDGTNNLAERELRSMVMLRKNSFGSDTCTGMERDAILASVVQTLHRQQLSLLISLKQYLQAGISKA